MFDTLLPDGSRATLYTITGGGLQAQVMDFGATLVSLFVPDRQGQLVDVVLGYDRAVDYAVNNSNLGATVGRNANRVANARFLLDGQPVELTPNDHEKNNLHSGPDIYNHRMWQVQQVSGSSVTLCLHSPHGDQGFPGNATICVTYTLTPEGSLQIRYEAVSDRKTVVNLTNHSYFNLFGQQHPERAMEQLLYVNAQSFTPADANSIPTGQILPVADTPMDFTTPKAVGRDIGQDFLPLQLQQGYDHNYVLAGAPAARLSCPERGIAMEVITDRPGLQVYSGNYLDKLGKNGIHYTPRGAVCLETQYFPDAVNKPHWPQPVLEAGERMVSVTEYKFSQL